jgi:nitrile hydratase subunit beta
MNGVHDMGGMHGFGPVNVHDSAPYHDDWEIHMRAITNTCGQKGYIPSDDVLRRAIEEMPPDRYLRSSYFERWEYATEQVLIERGILTRAELDARCVDLAPGAVAQPVMAPRFENAQEPPAIEATSAIQRFDVGDHVRVRNEHPERHTRSPRYVRGKVGVIQRCHGHEIFPDVNSEYLPDQPQVVYSVQFEGQELWGPSAESRTLLSIDLWDSYLEPA